MNIIVAIIYKIKYTKPSFVEPGDVIGKGDGISK
jgi:hypothetical protein